MGYRKWNWMYKDWPRFTFDTTAIEQLELVFAKHTGATLGILKHTSETDQEGFLIDILSNEAITTSAIEGEILDRDSVQSSIKQNLGLTVEKKRLAPSEYGISELMVDLYLNYHIPLTHDQLFEWHRMLTNGRRDLLDIGKYRTHKEPMQVISGRVDKPTIHFEAPPSHKVLDEMEQFVKWFHYHHFEETNVLLPLTKAGIAHLYFVCIHPFEDGNGRIGRAIAEKSLALSLGKPALSSLSQTINNAKNEYYEALAKYNATLDITGWILYFGETIVQAQESTVKQLEFLIKKAKFLNTYNDRLNDRQLKVILRIFKEGYHGFKGGLSAHNYKTIAKTTASTATRDLQDLVSKEVLTKIGTLKSTRYFLNLKGIK